MQEAQEHRPAFEAFVGAAEAALKSREKRGGCVREHLDWKLEALVRLPPAGTPQDEIPHDPYFWGIKVQALHRVDLLAPVTRGLHTEDTVEDAAKRYLISVWEAAEALVSPKLDLRAPLAKFKAEKWIWAMETWRKGIVDDCFRKQGRYMVMHWCIMKH